MVLNNMMVKMILILDYEQSDFLIKNIVFFILNYFFYQIILPSFHGYRFFGSKMY